MKKILTVLLLIGLLSGCGRSLAGEIPPTTQETLPLPEAGTYVPTSPMEQRTQGAVRVYDLGLADITGICCWGEDLLVFSGRTTTTLTLFTGEELTKAGSIALDLFLDPADDGFHLEEDSLSFYDPANAQVLILDSSLTLRRRIAVPADLTGFPLFSPTQNTLYYCTASALRAWDLDSGIRRTVAELNYPSQTVSGLAEGGSILLCRVKNTPLDTTLVLDSSTGSLLCRGSRDLQLEMEADAYYATFSAGTIQTLVYGSSSENLQQLLPEEFSAESLFLPRQRQAVSLWQSQEGSYQLTLYRLADGMKCASLLLDSTALPLFCADSCGNIYILPNDSSLCRWHPPEDAPSVGQSCSFPYYFQQTDAVEMELCKIQAQTLGEQFGIEILVGEDALAVPPWDYSLEAETSPCVIRRELELLEQWLSNYPDVLFRETSAHFDSFKLCLVRTLTGTPDSGALTAAAGVQYFRNSTAYLVLAVGKNAQRGLYHEFYHVMQTHLLTQTSALDHWEDLNPSGFSYDLDYAANAQRQSGVYLTKGSRAFIDTYSMSFPKEDQARIMEYAMLPGQQQLFREPILQEKLRTLCLALRDAYSLEECTQPYLWEQYLDPPLG